MRRLAAYAAALTLTLAATACASDSSSTPEEESLKGQTITVAGVWTGVEAKNFKKVLAAFSAKTGATTRFMSTGDKLSEIVGDKIKRGGAPDVVMVPQLGVLQQFVNRGWLRPLSEEALRITGSNFAQVWWEYGSVNGDFYGVYFKASHKSTVWYDPKAFDKAKVEPPTTFDQMLRVGHALSDKGIPAFSVAGESGWPLTDWFENIYLSQAGPERYDLLAAHKIPWTHPSVVRALKTLGKLFSDGGLVAGGGKHALKTDFPESVNAVFGKAPEAGMVYEGDFVGGLISGDHKKKVGEDAKFFPFPPLGDGEPAVVGGGDAAVVLKKTKHREAAMRFVEYLASTEAAEVWAKLGGFVSPSENLDPSAYADETTRKTAQSLVDAGNNVRFDMSDQAPAAFGGTPGSGEWKILQDFLRDPSDPEATARTLEAAAADAYGY